MIRIDVTGFTQWGSSWPRKRVCGSGAFERIVEIRGKIKSPRCETGSRSTRHNAEIHDRAIVIDDLGFYALGASIKDMGMKLSVVNRLEDAESTSRLRAELNRIWASAVPL